MGSKEQSLQSISKYNCREFFIKDLQFRHTFNGVNNGVQDLACKVFSEADDWVKAGFKPLAVVDCLWLQHWDSV